MEILNYEINHIYRFFCIYFLQCTKGVYRNNSRVGAKFFLPPLLKNKKLFIKNRLYYADMLVIISNSMR